MPFAATCFSLNLPSNLTSLLKVAQLQDLFGRDVACSIHQRSILLDILSENTPLETSEILKETFAVVSLQTEKLAIAIKVVRKEAIWRVNLQFSINNH